MRLFNPEWEAIREFEHTATVRDLLFDLEGRELPADHGHALFEELARHLPWLRETPEAGLHPVHGAPSGRNANLVINRRVKLVLRLPLARLADARVLEGKTIDPGAGPLVIGPAKEKPLTPFPTLYAHSVDMGSSDEAGFLQAARAELDEMGIPGGLIPGRHWEMHTPNGVIGGYSLMLHDISLAQSITVQERGVGRHRGYGCGIFIPHKSIKEVGGG
ncbi:MAG: type I-MYXAN CRISPR-associated protein Cas6/Cmx6 [Pseudomonadota bacterium]